jgi:hypothetical protein
LREEVKVNVLENKILSTVCGLKGDDAVTDGENFIRRK